MKKEAIKYKIIVSIGIFILIFFGISYFLLWPEMGKINDIFVKIQQKKVDIEVNQNKAEKLSEIRQQFNLVEKQNKELAVLFQKDDIVPVVEKMEQIASDTNNVITVKIEDEKAGAKISKKEKNKKEKDKEMIKEKLSTFPEKEYFAMQVILLGEYKDALNFMDKLDKITPENDVYLIEMTSYNISDEKSPLSPKKQLGGVSLIAGSGSFGNDKLTNFKGKSVLETKLKVVFYLE